MTIIERNSKCSATKLLFFAKVLSAKRRKGARRSDHGGESSQTGAGWSFPGRSHSSFIDTHLPHRFPTFLCFISHSLPGEWHGSLVFRLTQHFCKVDLQIDCFFVFLLFFLVKAVVCCRGFHIRHHHNYSNDVQQGRPWRPSSCWVQKGSCNNEQRNPWEGWEESSRCEDNRAESPQPTLQLSTASNRFQLIIFDCRQSVKPQ